MQSVAHTTSAACLDPNLAGGTWEEGRSLGEPQNTWASLPPPRSPFNDTSFPSPLYFDSQASTHLDRATSRGSYLISHSPDWASWLTCCRAGGTSAKARDKRLKGHHGRTLHSARSEHCDGSDVRFIYQPKTKRNNSGWEKLTSAIAGIHTGPLL